MAQHSDQAVCIGDTIHGRCVTMNSLHTGRVANIIQTPGEYTTRFRLEPDSDRPEGRIVFCQGFACPDAPPAPAIDA